MHLNLPANIEPFGTMRELPVVVVQLAAAMLALDAQQHSKGPVPPQCLARMSDRQYLGKPCPGDSHSVTGENTSSEEVCEEMRSANAMNRTGSWAQQMTGSGRCIHWQAHARACCP